MAQGPHWIAGPVAYQADTRGNGTTIEIESIRFAFVGADHMGRFARYALVYEINTRIFRHYKPSMTKYESEEAVNRRLLNLHRPLAVFTVTLGKLSRVDQLKAMLSEEQIAELLAMSIGRQKELDL